MRRVEKQYAGKVRDLVRRVRRRIIRRCGRTIACSGVSDYSEDSGTRIDFLAYPRKYARQPLSEIEAVDLCLGVDISLSIAMSEKWDGEEEGVNFLFDVVETGGAIVSSFVPHNYTNAVWVARSDEDAVARRWDEFEYAVESAIEDIVDSVVKRLREQRPWRPKKERVA